jgi:hypothetical protein
MPEVASQLELVKQENVPIHFTVYEPVQLRAIDPAFMALQIFSFQGALDEGEISMPHPRRISIVKAMFKDEDQRITCMPTLVATILKRFRSVLPGVPLDWVYPRIVGTIYELLVDQPTLVHDRIRQAELNKMENEKWFQLGVLSQQSTQSAQTQFPQMAHLLVRAIDFAMRLTAATTLVKKIEDLNELAIVRSHTLIETSMPPNGLQVVDGLLQQGNFHLAWGALALLLRASTQAILTRLKEKDLE